MRGNMDFWEIYNEYFGRIYAYIRCRTACAAEAEDLASAVFHKALARLAQFDPAKGNYAQWLFGIARNEVNYQFRLKSLRTFLPLHLFENLLPSREAAPETEEGGEVAALQAALAKLAARERDLISLKYYSGLNNREIAGLTGLSESNVGTILYRCMARLREELAEN